MPALGQRMDDEGDQSDFVVLDSALDAERGLSLDLQYNLSVDDLDGVEDAPPKFGLSRVADLG